MDSQAETPVSDDEILQGAIVLEGHLEAALDGLIRAARRLTDGAPKLRIRLVEALAWAERFGRDHARIWRRHRRDVVSGQLSNLCREFFDMPVVAPISTLSDKVAFTGRLGRLLQEIKAVQQYYRRYAPYLANRFQRKFSQCVINDWDTYRALIKDASELFTESWREAANETVDSATV